MQRHIIPDIVEEGRDLLTMPAAATVRDASRAMSERSVGAVLIVDGERLAGIFTERDLVNRVVARDRDPGATPLSEVMTREPDSIAPDATAMEALRLMEDGGYRHLPVVAAGGRASGDRVVGIVSRRDFFASEKARLETETGLWERL